MLWPTSMTLSKTSPPPPHPTPPHPTPPHPATPGSSWVLQLTTKYAFFGAYNSNKVYWDDSLSYNSFYTSVTPPPPLPSAPSRPVTFLQPSKSPTLSCFCPWLKTIRPINNVTKWWSASRSHQKSLSNWRLWMLRKHFSLAMDSLLILHRL